MGSLGERLKQARENKGWSQTYVCGVLQISNSRLSGYERNYREPDTKMFTALSSLYEVSIDWLMGKNIQPIPSSSALESNHLFRDPELQKWYKELPNANEEDVQKLMKIWGIIRNE
ncbi:helix-turn-helix domain-containing protein [Halobacillus campisalis]|uniref:Helix-turn-helix domain-containing protein n=1 Tax=Halobacillus campisalis TaxID=435909 RepID=A0ABW2JZV9_9BACI|nr:helix-turn-helix transcriptional regulator [Halobacillus campisalis]